MQSILDTMDWLGLRHDGKPLRQSQRSDLYQAALRQLLEDGHAYRCYCSQSDLEQMRRDARAGVATGRATTVVAGSARRRRTAPTQRARCCAFRNPDAGAVRVHDLVQGEVQFDNRELDDLVLARQDGSPTYNLCTVVDDQQLRITHVIRGDDHLNNTPRQINICRALGAEPPRYAHLPMILDAEGKKLSKRTQAASALYYREQGYLPEALLNYLLRLGWSHGDEEIFSPTADARAV